MKKSFKHIITIIGFSLTILLNGCGGGSGDTKSSSKPVFTTSNSTEVFVDSITAISVRATDADGDQITYTIAGGSDADLFEITDAGQVTFLSPAEEGTYNIIVTATAGIDNVDQSISILVTTSSLITQNNEFDLWDYLVSATNVTKHWELLGTVTDQYISTEAIDGDLGVVTDYAVSSRPVEMQIEKENNLIIIDEQYSISRFVEINDIFIGIYNRKCKLTDHIDSYATQTNENGEKGIYVDLLQVECSSDDFITIDFIDLYAKGIGHVAHKYNIEADEDLDEVITIDDFIQVSANGFVSQLNEIDPQVSFYRVEKYKASDADYIIFYDAEIDEYVALDFQLLKENNFSALQATQAYVKGDFVDISEVVDPNSSAAQLASDGLHKFYEGLETGYLY